MVFLDSVHFHVRSEGQIVKKAVYIAIGIDIRENCQVLDGYSERPEELRRRRYPDCLC